MSTLEKIYLASIRFLQPLSLEETYKVIVEESVKLVNGDSGRIFLVEKDKFIPAYSSSPDRLMREPRRKGNVYLSFAKNKAFVAHSREIAKTYPKYSKAGIRSIMYIPLSNNNVAYGVMTIRSKKDIFFKKDELSILKLFGSSASLAIKKSQLYEETKKAADTRDLFISLAAHELRTPMTTINGYIQLILAKLRDKREVDPKWIYELAFESNRLKSLVDEFLDISRIRTGKIQYEWKEVHLKEIIKKAILSYGFVKPDRKVLLKDKLNGKKDLIIGDIDQLIRVITNLLENADKYSPSQEKIEVALKSKPSFYSIEVADKGQGIPKEEISYVFKGFYKGKKSLHEGMGLGLFLAKNIIDRHKGEIFIESKVGVGTKITIKLPRTKDES